MDNPDGKTVNAKQQDYAANKIIVLGTSNSILKGGWVDGLREAPEISVQNFSIGASASAFALWQILDADLSLPESSARILIDTVVNDEAFVDAARLDTGWWYFYQQLLLRAVRPWGGLMVGFSSQKLFGGRSQIALLQERLCHAEGIQFLSLRRVLQASLRIARSRRPEASINDIFEDPGHFHRHLSHIFGIWLGEHFPALCSPPSVAFSLTDAGFENLVPVAHDGISEQRFTSLRKQDTVRFEINQKFWVSGPRILHGICIDASNTRCYLNFSQEGAQESLSVCYNSQSGRMQVKFVHFLKPIVVGPKGIDIQVSDTPEFVLAHGIHSRPDGGDLSGLRLLSFLSGPVMDRPEPPEMPDSAAGLAVANTLTEIEKEAVRKSGLIEILVNPPNIPPYPRSFIEL